MTDRDDDFQPIPDLPGRLYVPRPRGRRKHPCPDCFACQQCSDSRCAACRCGGDGESKAPPSGPPPDQATKR